jgi:hypothetical protein
MADTGGKGHFIGLKLHPGTPPISEAASGQVLLDIFQQHGDAGGKAFQQRNQFRTVRFTSS